METGEERVTVVNTGGDQAVDEDRGTVGGEREVGTVDVTKVEVGRLGDGHSYGTGMRGCFQG